MIRFSLLLMLCFTFIACAQVVGPKASSQQMEFDFGTISEGKVATHNYILLNTGGDSLRITDIHASCGCTAAKPDKNELAPGESINIKVDFNSTGKMGKQEKYVYVKTNDPNNPELKFKLTGNVVNAVDMKESLSSPQLSFAEAQHDFGKVNEGKVVNYTFKFRNSGKGVLEINNVSTSCSCTNAQISSKVIKPGEEGTLRVDLDTKGHEGEMNRNITIKSNDPKEPNKTLIIFADVIRENK
ncbi:MAG: DUF1573 domain-containing protein [Ignavibacteriaceae bacterium]|nr:DUF1573 domain-containing protein [Ignavibacteriaceae bacterium]